MVYVAPSRNFLKNRLGTDSSLIAEEFTKLDTAIDSAKVQIVDLTPSAVSTSSLAATGVALANDPATAVTWYSTFLAPVDCTIISMDVYFTVAYVKATGDASIVLKTEASSPVTKVTYSIPAAGVALRSMVSTAPSDAVLAAGTLLNILVTPTTVTTGGTGKAKVFLRYTVN